MQRKIVTSLVGLLGLLFIFPYVVHAANMDKITIRKDYKIDINDYRLELKEEVPIVYKDSLYIPLRVFADQLGFSLQWNNEEKQLTLYGNDRTVINQIESTITLVNGQAMAMDKPTLVYKGRSYVPVRFFISAFDGSTYFDQSKRLIKINIQAKVVGEKSNIGVNRVYLEQKNWEIIDELKLINNSIYIPLRLLLDQLGLEYSINYLGNYTVYENDKKIDIYTNSRVIFVDGVAKTLQTEPIVQNGELYVHIRWVENVLGAYVAYSSETKTLSIDLIEPKFKLKMLEKLNESIITPVNVPAAQLTGDTRLLYSNNPETLSYETVKTEQVTLWHDIVETDKDLVKHRVYGWHINELGEDGQVGITVENLSSENSISVKQIKGISKVSERSWQIYDIGLPIAEAYMGGFLNAEPHDIPVSSSNSALIKSFELKENHLIGFLYEFTVEKSSGKGDLNYKIRTVFSTDNNDLTNIKGEPIPLDLDRRHPRGSWEQADLEATLPVYETSSKEVSYSISNGLTDHLMTKETSIDSDHALGNPGHFGAVYKVNIPLINSSDRAKTVRIRLGARGGQAAVAIKHKEGSFISPFLKDFTEAAKIMDVEIGSDESKEIELTIMHGGGSNLPVAINLSTLE